MLNLQLSSSAFKNFFFTCYEIFFLTFVFWLLVFVLQHSFFNLWVLTSSFTLVFMMHWCYPWNLSLKLYWLLSWQLSCFNTCLCNMATLVDFSIKLHKHSPLPRSLINTHLCNEATAALFFSHKVGSTIHLHWNHANIHVCHEVASPLIFVMKLRQLLLCVEASPLLCLLKQICTCPF